MAAARAMRKLGCRRQRRRFTRLLNALAEKSSRFCRGASCDAKWSRGLFDLLRLHLEVRGFLPAGPSLRLLSAGCNAERYSFLSLAERVAPGLLARFGRDLLADPDLSFAARVGNSICEVKKALPGRIERMLLDGTVHEKAALAVYAPACTNIFARKHPGAICAQGDERLRLIMMWTTAARQWRGCGSALANAMTDKCPLMRIIALETVSRLGRKERVRLLSALPERDPNVFVDRVLSNLRRGAGISDCGSVELWLEPAAQSGRNSSAPNASR
ncbi:MAG: hypothetical protein D6806_12360 [Deltaproteobacteria bacterium]|nr:MAG: hypothetical protein D6806_12360 [Deltaproteobacteria bacterium]